MDKKIIGGQSTRLQMQTKVYTINQTLSSPVLAFFKVPPFLDNSSSVILICF